MRYKVTIGQEYVAGNVANTVSVNHGLWEHSTDQVRGYRVVSITANHCEDAELCAEMDAYSGVIEYQVIGQTEAEKLADMAEVLERQGEFYHGGRVEEVAVEWFNFGFNAISAKSWMLAKVWQPSVAADLRRMGHGPSQLRSVPDDTIYAWCNGDKSIVWPTTDDTEAAQ